MTTAEPIVKIPARKRGNALGFWFFKTSLRIFGLRGAYGLLYLVCAYYLLFDRAAVVSALAYVRRRFPDHGWFRRRIDVYLLFVNQGKNLLDRYYLLAGGEGIAIRLEGLEKIADVLKEEQGFVLLMAHLGNWQAIMTTLRQFNRKIHLVMRPEDNPAVAESLRIDAGEANIAVISSEDPLGGIVAIMNAIKQGGIVAIMGDRSYAFASVDIEFLGAPARFSCGAFHIAALAACPVVMLTAARKKRGEYIVTIAGVFRPRYQPEADKRQQLRGWVREFAALMEQYVAQYPFQCFLFYDIWREAAEQAGVRRAD